MKFETPAIHPELKLRTKEMKPKVKTLGWKAGCPASKGRETSPAGRIQPPEGASPFSALSFQLWAKAAAFGRNPPFRTHILPASMST